MNLDTSGMTARATDRLPRRQRNGEAQPRVCRRETDHLGILQPRCPARFDHVDLTNPLDALGIDHPRPAGRLELAGQAGNASQVCSSSGCQEDQVGHLAGRLDARGFQLAGEFGVERALYPNRRAGLYAELVEERGRMQDLLRPLLRCRPELQVRALAAPFQPENAARRCYAAQVAKQDLQPLSAPKQQVVGLEQRLALQRALAVAQPALFFLAHGYASVATRSPVLAPRSLKNDSMLRVWPMTKRDTNRKNTLRTSPSSVMRRSAPSGAGEISNVQVPPKGRLRSAMRTARRAGGESSTSSKRIFCPCPSCSHHCFLPSRSGSGPKPFTSERQSGGPARIEYRACGLCRKRARRVA